LLYGVEAFLGGGIFIRQGIYSKFFSCRRLVFIRAAAYAMKKNVIFFAFLFGGMKIKAVY
jgi:hypothetical protein